MRYKIFFFFLSAALFFVVFSFKPDWGFFAHKRINRLAVFCLPDEMYPLYKTKIEYLTEHAVDPDKRRYATKHEGVRHYIDLDHWGHGDFEHVPRTFDEAIARFSKVILIDTIKNDTTYHDWKLFSDTIKNSNSDPILDDFQAYQNIISEDIMLRYYDGPIWEIENLFEVKAHKIFIEDQFSAYGVLPYNLITHQRKLTEAFVNKDWERAIRLSGDFGHYIGDAHVPLHTTENYNGQLTNQSGIHGFWESRIPELIADEQFDYLVGKADYIEDKVEYFWSIVMKSHSYVDSVLSIEKRLSLTFPEDQQYCFTDRNGINVLQACPAYATSFNREMNGMVEERFRASVHSVASVWYTAWVDAGRPDLNESNITMSPAEEQFERNSNIKTRVHE